jgi:hypothetical protein
MFAFDTGEERTLKSASRVGSGMSTNTGFSTMSFFSTPTTAMRCADEEEDSVTTDILNMRHSMYVTNREMRRKEQENQALMFADTEDELAGRHLQQCKKPLPIHEEQSETIASKNQAFFMVYPRVLTKGRAAKIRLEDYVNYKHAGFFVNALWSIRRLLLQAVQRGTEVGKALSDEINDCLHELATNQYNSRNSVIALLLDRGCRGLTDECLSSYPNISDANSSYHIPGIDYLKHDVTGATLVHQVYRFEKYNIGRMLVRLFPDFCLEPYSDTPPITLFNRPLDKAYMPFSGQTILHMCVLRGAHAEARWILDFYRKKSLIDLNTILFQPVTGTSFRPVLGRYCGETALHLAVCTGDRKMVDIILSYIASVPERSPSHTSSQTSISLLFAPDSRGNNLIHLCVIHNLVDMYNHIKWRVRNVIMQELMVALHISDQLIYHPPNSPTVDTFGQVFKGYIRKCREVQLPAIDSVAKDAMQTATDLLGCIMKDYHSAVHMCRILRPFMDPYKCEDAALIPKLDVITSSIPLRQLMNNDSLHRLRDVRQGLRTWLSVKRAQRQHLLDNWLYGDDRDLNVGSIRQVCKNCLAQMHHILACLLPHVLVY